MSQNNSNIPVAMCWEKKSIFECLIENRHLKQVVAWLFARRVKERNGFSVNGATLCFLLKLRVAFYRVGHWFDFAATCAGGAGRELTDLNIRTLRWTITSIWFIWIGKMSFEWKARHCWREEELEPKGWGSWLRSPTARCSPIYWLHQVVEERQKVVGGVSYTIVRRWMRRRIQLDGRW